MQKDRWLVPPPGTAWQPSMEMGAGSGPQSMGLLKQWSDWLNQKSCTCVSLKQRRCRELIAGGGVIEQLWPGWSA